MSQAPQAYPSSPAVAVRPPVGQPVQLSRFDVDEILVTGLAGLIPRQPGAIRLAVPVDMTHRAVYLFLEAVPTVADDFELEAQLSFRRNGVIIHTLPCSIGSNGNATTVTKTRLTAFANVAAGTIEALYAIFANPQTAAGGSATSALTPNKLEIEMDEIWLDLLSSADQGASFSSWRALLAVRSSKIAL